MLTVKQLTQPYDRWRQQWISPHRKNQQSWCGVRLPTPRFEIDRGWTNATTKRVYEQSDGFGYSSRKKAHKAARMSYNSEKKCTSYRSGGSTIYPTGHFKHHFKHTVVYCKTEKFLYKGRYLNRDAVCMFTVKNARYSVYVTGYRSGSTSKAEALISRVVHNVYG